MYETIQLMIEWHHKKTVGANFLLLTHPLRTNHEAQVNISKSLEKDILWMADTATDTNEFELMWIGMNTNLILSDDCIQEIRYLLQINQSSTSCTVACETMNKFLKISTECGKQNIPFIDDLAIALQIQAEKSPEFDNIFVTIESFHIKLALFKASGKTMSESDSLYILNENLVLAAGSISELINGKAYKTCKKNTWITLTCIQKSSFLITFTKNTKFLRCLEYNSIIIKDYQKTPR